MYLAHPGAPCSSQICWANPAALLMNATLWIRVSGRNGHVCFPCHDLPGGACTDSQYCTADATTLANVKSAFQSLQGLVRLVDATYFELCWTKVLHQAALDTAVACR